jgi:hypothetical protein
VLNREAQHRSSLIGAQGTEQALVGDYQRAPEPISGFGVCHTVRPCVSLLISAVPPANERRYGRPEWR